MTATADKILVKARIKLLAAGHAFDAYFAMKRPWLPVTAQQCATAATDGDRFYYNPDFILRLYEEQGIDGVVGLVRHEVGHVTREHHLRRNGRDPRQWNEAGDFQINGDLDSDGTTLPSGALLDAQYKGLSTEDIYKRLGKRPEGDEGDGDDGDQGDQGDDQQGQGQGQGDDGDQEAPEGAQGAAGDQQGSPSTNPGRPAPGGAPGEVWDAVNDDGSPLTPDQVEQKRRELREDIVRAARMHEKQHGSLPGGVERVLTDALEPEVDWRALLADFSRTSLDRLDYSLRRFNRGAYVSTGVLLPTLLSESYPPLVVAIDTSASISSHYLAVFLAEIVGLSEELNVVIYTVPCDTQVYEDAVQEHVPYEFDASDVKTPGHGGTDFRPVFDYLADRFQGEEIGGLVYLTDLDGPFPDEEPDYPVLWATYNARNQKAPFGQTVEIDRD